VLCQKFRRCLFSGNEQASFLSETLDFLEITAGLSIAPRIVNRKELLLSRENQQYSFRETLATTVKLVMIGAGVFGVLWMLDRVVTQ
jgi:hypothetical protein